MSATKLLIENLDREATENHLRFILSLHGSVSTVRLFRNKRRAIVEMATAADARRVRNTLDGASLWGRAMHITEKRSGLVTTIRMLLM